MHDLDYHIIGTTYALEGRACHTTAHHLFWQMKHCWAQSRSSVYMLPVIAFLQQR